MSGGPEERDEACEGSRPGDGEPQPQTSDRGGDVSGEPARPPRSELVPTGPLLAESLYLYVREHLSRAFRPPTSAPPPVGMATNGQVQSFRELRTRLMLMAADVGLPHFTTMVVPVSEGSGGSFVARNLAAAFTLQQRLALLIDCNFRDATQHEAFALEDGAGGLLDFIGQPTEVPIECLIRPTPLAGLHVIPAGGSVVGGPPREHLSSPPMKALLSALRHEPCDVFLDGPAVEGSPDARILSDLADFVVLVVGYARTTASAVTRAASLFDRKKFAGVVFNDFESAGVRRGRPEEH